MTRAIKATVKAGIEVSRVEIDKEGKIVVVTGKPKETDSEEPNPWDGVADETKRLA